MSPVQIRDAVFPRDEVSVAGLVEAYLRQTEAEKAERGLAESVLPERYAREVADPATTFAGRRVLLASVDGVDCGMLVLSATDPGTDLSRLWTAPLARGRGVGSALLTAALHEATRPVRLSVWEWRQPALRLYRGIGFQIVPAWDDRPGLVCLELR